MDKFAATADTLDMTKKTASNSKFLKEVKRIFNAPTFRHVAAVYNQHGIVAARDYLRIYSTLTFDCPIIGKVDLEVLE